MSITRTIPWNSYDANTARAAAELGFRYLSAGWDNPLDLKPCIKIIPRTTQIGTLGQAVDEAGRYSRLAPAVVVVIHHHDFAESGSPDAISSLATLDAALKSLQQNPAVTVEPVADIADRLPLTRSRLLATNRTWRRRLHWRLQWLLPGLTLASTSPARAAMHSALGVLHRHGGPQVR